MSITQEQINEVYNNAADDHYLRTCLTKPNMFTCINCVKALRSQPRTARDSSLGRARAGLGVNGYLDQLDRISFEGGEIPQTEPDYSDAAIAAMCLPPGEPMNFPENHSHHDDTRAERDSRHDEGGETQYQASSGFCPPLQACDGFVNITSQRQYCTPEQEDIIKSCASRTNSYDESGGRMPINEDTCGINCLSELQGGNLPVCIPNSNSEIPMNYIENINSMCGLIGQENQPPDFDIKPDMEGIEDISSLYYWDPSPALGYCGQASRLFKYTGGRCEDIKLEDYNRQIICENIIAVPGEEEQGFFCMSDPTTENRCITATGFPVPYDLPEGSCHMDRKGPILPMPKKNNPDGTPDFNRPITDSKVLQHCKMRPSCERDSQTSRNCKINNSGVPTLTSCSKNPSASWYADDNPLCDASFSVNEDADEASKNIKIGPFSGESILNCSRSPLCLAGWAATGLGVGGIAKGVKLYRASRAAQAVAVSQAGAGGATAANAGFTAVAPVGGWMGATAATGGRAAAGRAAMGTGWGPTFSVKGAIAGGAAAATYAGALSFGAEVTDDTDLAERLAASSIEAHGHTCSDGWASGCQMNVNVDDVLFGGDNDDTKWRKIEEDDISNCKIYWHEGHPICCSNGVKCEYGQCDGEVSPFGW